MLFVLYELLFWLAVVAIPFWLWLDLTAALWAMLGTVVIYAAVQGWMFERFQKWLNFLIILIIDYDR
jgi:hypothetical protein